MADIFRNGKKASTAPENRLSGDCHDVGATEINPETWEELEALLIQADVGVETSQTDHQQPYQ